LVGDAIVVAPASAGCSATSRSSRQTGKIVNPSEPNASSHAAVQPGHRNGAACVAAASCRHGPAISATDEKDRTVSIDALLIAMCVSRALIRSAILGAVAPPRTSP
jgi:hypothetical protein